MSNFELMPAMSIASTGMDAERTRMDIIANNLSNVHSTRGENGECYRRRIPVFESVFNDEISQNPTANLGGVKLEEISYDDRDPIDIYAPYHPDANSEGMVAMPNISPIEEMVDMITATRAYETNLSVIKNSRKMAEQTIGILK